MGDLLWTKVDREFLNDPAVELLGDQFGPGGPLLILDLILRAGKARSGGKVTTTIRSLRNSSFIDDAGRVEDILARGVELEVITVDRDRQGELTVTLPNWKKWQANARKAEQRQREADGTTPPEKTKRDSSVTTERESKSKRESKRERKKKSQTASQSSSATVPAADAPLSHLLADRVADNDPNGTRPRVTRRWADQERLMIERDNRKPDEAKRLIEWTVKDSFWAGNVLSMPKFREKYTTLYHAATRDKKAKQTRGLTPEQRKAKADAMIAAEHAATTPNERTA